MSVVQIIFFFLIFQLGFSTLSVAQKVNKDLVNQGTMGNLYLNLGDSLLEENYYEEAFIAFNQSLVHYEEVYGQGNSENIKAYEAIGKILLEKGYTTKAIEYYQKGLALLRAQPDLDYYLIGRQYKSIAGVYQYHKQGEIAVNYYNKALEAYKKAKGKAHIKDMLDILILFGNSYYAEGDLGMASNYYKQAVALLSKVDTKFRADIEELYTRLSQCMSMSGSFRMAQDYLNEAVVICRKVYGKNAVKEGEKYQLMAELLFKQEKYDSTHVNLLKAEAIFLFHPEDKHSIHIWQRKNASMFLPVRQFRYGVLWYEKYLESLRQSTSELDKVEDAFKTVVANLIGYRQFSEAVYFYELLLAFYQEQLGEQNAKSAEVMYKIAELYKKDGQQKRALRYNHKAHDMKINLLQTNQLDTLLGYIEIGTLYQLKNDQDSATRYYHLALDEVAEDVNQQAVVYNNLSMLYYDNAVYDSAMFYAKNLKALYEETLNFYDTKTQGAIMLMANIYYALGEKDIAFRYYIGVYRTISYLYQLGNVVALDANRNMAELYKRKGIDEKARFFKENALVVEKKLNGVF